MGGLLDFFSKGKLKSTLRSETPEIVLSWMNRAAHLVQPGPWINIGRLGGYYDLKYYRGCDFLVCNTPDIAKHCIENGWPADKVDYIPNFSPVVDSPAVDKLAISTPEGAPVLLVLARLEDAKGIDVALRSLKVIPDAYLWIAGEGSKEGALKSLAKSLGVEERVRFLGWRADREALLKTADVCLVPSRHEPFGNVIVNAWANNTPVVAAASQGPSFLIKNTVNGLLFPIDDSQALANSIQQVLNDQNFADQLIDGGREQARGPFSRDTVVRAYCDLFERRLKAAG